MKLLDMRKHEFFFPTIIWLINLLLSIGVVYLSTNFIPHGKHIETSIANNWFQGFFAWDGEWYIRIAKEGYLGIKSTAFFPLYPMMIRVINSITKIPHGYIGWILSNISLLIALNLLYKLTTEIWGELVAKKTIFFAIVFPGTLFFNAVYTESLTLLLSVLFFYFLKKDRWIGALLCGFIASGLKQLGVVFAIVALIYLIRNRKRFSKKVFLIKLISLGIIPLSLGLYMLYTYLTFGDLFAFIHAQKYWGREAVIPVFNIIRSLRWLVLHGDVFDSAVRRLLNGLTALLFVYLGFRMLQDKKKQVLGIELKVYYIITLLLSISSGPGGDTEPYARHMSTLFFGYITLGTMINSKVFMALCGILLYACKLFVLGLFCNGYSIT